MAMFASIVALSLAASTSPAIVEAGQVSLASPSVRLGDVVRSARGRLQNQVIANIPAGRDRLVLSRAAIADLVHRALPGFVLADARSGNVTLVLPVTNALQPTERQCRQLTISVSANAIIEPEMAKRVACSDARPAAISFDRTASVARATQDLAAGSYLGRLSLSAPGLRKGEATSLVSTIGPVRVVRAVTTMQASRGRRVFVRDADGQIFSVRRAELTR